MKKIEKWKTLSSEYLFKRPWLTARRDTVELPDGRINNEYYVLEYPRWVNMIAITDDGNFVMVEQYRHGLGEILVELCAGVVEEGETTEEGARRELLEETGFAGGTYELMSTFSANAGSTNNLTYGYLLKGVKKVDTKQHLDATEDIAVRILSRDEVFDMLMHDQIKQATMAAMLWKYFAVLEN